MSAQAHALGRKAERASAMQHEVTMAEINKLSVGKVLDKLRRDDVPKNVKTNQFDKKIRTAEEEIERLRAASLRLKRGHRGGAAGRD
jgi:hypothetical protein